MQSLCSESTTFAQNTTNSDNGRGIVDSISTITSFVLNVTDGMSYDKAFQMHKIKGRTVVTVSSDKMCEIHEALSALSENKPSLGLLGAEIRRHVAQVGFEATTLNFECCSSYGHGVSCGNHHAVHRAQCYHFCDPETSIAVIDTIVFMLSMGSQVICADFALKALISNWDKEKFKAPCPLINLGVIQGSLRVRYGIEQCKESAFPQLRSLAMMALPDRSETTDEKDGEKSNVSQLQTQTQTQPQPQVSSVTMEAMSKTIVYGVVKSIDPKLSVKVLSVAVGRTESEIHDAKIDPEIPLYPLMCPSHLQPVKLKRQNACENTNIKDNDLDILSTGIHNLLAPVDPAPMSSTSLDVSFDQLPKFKRQLTVLEEPVRIVDYKDMFAEKVVSFPEESYTCKAEGIDVQGTPVHAIIEFAHFPGTLVVSSLHLTNLLQVNTDTQHVLSVAESVLGRQRSSQMECELEYAESQTPELLRATTSALVAEITSGSTNLFPKSKTF